MKKHEILALIIASVNVLFMLFVVQIYYDYHFTNKLFLFKYSDWLLLLNFAIAIFGIFLSMLLYKGKCRVKIILFLTIILWLLALTLYGR
jgi:hypothetical protein